MRITLRCEMENSNPVEKYATLDFLESCGVTELTKHSNGELDEFEFVMHTDDADDILDVVRVMLYGNDYQLDQIEPIIAQLNIVMKAQKPRPGGGLQ